jgi:hypothetical protein
MAARGLARHVGHHLATHVLWPEIDGVSAPGAEEQHERQGEVPSRSQAIRRILKMEVEKK